MFCEETFFKKESLINHEKEHEKIDPKRLLRPKEKYPCIFCEEVFYRKQSWINHEKEHELIDPKRLLRPKEGDYIWIEPQTKREFDVAVGARVTSAEGRRIQVIDDDGKESSSKISDLLDLQQELFHNFIKNAYKIKLEINRLKEDEKEDKVVILDLDYSIGTLNEQLTSIISNENMEFLSFSLIDMRKKLMILNGCKPMQKEEVEFLEKDPFLHKIQSICNKEGAATVGRSAIYELSKEVDKLQNDLCKCHLKAINNIKLIINDLLEDHTAQKEAITELNYSMSVFAEKFGDLISVQTLKSLRSSLQDIRKKLRTLKGYKLLQKEEEVAAEDNKKFLPRLQSLMNEQDLLLQKEAEDAAEDEKQFLPRLQSLMNELDLLLQKEEVAAEDYTKFLRRLQSLMNEQVLDAAESKYQETDSSSQNFSAAITLSNEYESVEDCQQQNEKAATKLFNILPMDENQWENFSIDNLVHLLEREESLENFGLRKTVSCPKLIETHHISCSNFKKKYEDVSEHTAYTEMNFEVQVKPILMKPPKPNIKPPAEGKIKQTQSAQPTPEMKKKMKKKSDSV